MGIIDRGNAQRHVMDDLEAQGLQIVFLMVVVGLGVGGDQHHFRHGAGAQSLHHALGGGEGLGARGLAHGVEDLLLALQSMLHGIGGAVKHDDVAARVPKGGGGAGDILQQRAQGLVVDPGHAQPRRMQAHVRRQEPAKMWLGQAVGRGDDESQTSAGEAGGGLQRKIGLRQRSCGHSHDGSSLTPV